MDRLILAMVVAATACGIGGATVLDPGTHVRGEHVTYHLVLTPADAGTRVTVRSTLEAVDRSEMSGFGPGLFQAILRHVEVPSRGVVERELMHRLASGLFTSEEMLLVLGEPGVD